MPSMVFRMAHYSGDAIQKIAGRIPLSNNSRKCIIPCSGEATLYINRLKVLKNPTVRITI
jgi:hypothetical protein